MKLYGTRANEVADRIVEAFRQPETLPQALAPVFIHRNDDVPCRKWSWHNQLVMALHGTVDARGMKQWNQVGRKVKAGSSAVWILAPCVKKVKEKDSENESCERTVLYGFRAIPVFAVEDTEGDPLPEKDGRLGDWIQQLPLLDVAQSWGIHVDAFTHDDRSPLGYYHYASNGTQAIMLGVENLSTWTHELVHAADHRIGGLTEAKWHKEVVAELGGAVLLECLGLHHDADLGGAYRYIESYADHANKPIVKACVEVIGRVCEAVNLILQTAQEAQPVSMSA